MLDGVAVQSIEPLELKRLKLQIRSTENRLYLGCIKGLILFICFTRLPRDFISFVQGFNVRLISGFVGLYKASIGFFRLSVRFYKGFYRFVRGFVRLTQAL